MKHLIVAVFAGMQIFLLADLLAAAPPVDSRSSLETMVTCHWLTASSEDGQGEQQGDAAEEDEEPDCD